MKIRGFAPDCKRVHLKKCLKKAPALNLKFSPNRLQPAAGRYNCNLLFFYRPELEQFQEILKK